MLAEEGRLREARREDVLPSHAELVQVAQRDVGHDVIGTIAAGQQPLQAPVQYVGTEEAVQQWQQRPKATARRFLRVDHPLTEVAHVVGAEAGEELGVDVDAVAEARSHRVQVRQPAQSVHLHRLVVTQAVDEDDQGVSHLPTPSPSGCASGMRGRPTACTRTRTRPRPGAAAANGRRSPPARRHSPWW